MFVDVDARTKGPLGSAAWLAGLVLAVVMTGLSTLPSAADSPVPPKPSRDREGAVQRTADLLETPLDDLPEPLALGRGRTEAEEDHLSALAHFSAGRACQQRKEPVEAIRHYQRALRWDPAAHGAVWPIVALAEELKWRDVRDRYLMAAARLDPGAFDPADLMELVDLISNDDELRLVTRRFEEAIAARKDEKKTPLDLVLRWRLAEIHVADKNYDRAADCAAGVLAALERPESHGLSRAKLEALFGAPHPPYWLFGEYFLLADRLDEAESTFEKAHKTKPDAARLHFQLARIDLRRKKPAAALEHLEACFREGRVDEGDEPYRLLREVLDELGKSDELAGRVEKLLADRSDDEALACFAARQYVASGRLDQASALYGRLLARNASPPIYAGLLAVYRKQGNLDGVLQVLGKAVAASPSLECLGDQVQAMAGDAAFLDKLLAAAERRLAENPAALGPRAPLAMALLATEAKRDAAADRFFEWAIRAAPRSASDVLLLWGGNLMARDEFAKAAEVFRRGVEGAAPDEDQPIFGYYLASALEFGGHTDEALAAARAALALNKNSPLLASHEAWILFHAKRNDEARAAYGRFLDQFKVNHASSGVRQAVREARLVLSNLEVRRGDHQKAAELLEEVLDEFPDDVSAANDLAYLWASQGMHLRRSLDMARRAVEAEPDNAAYRDSLGWALYRLGRLEEAAVELEKAAGDLPDGEVLDHLGEVYLKLGKTEQAADAWGRAADAYRKDGEPKAAAGVEAKRRAIAADDGLDPSSQ